MSQFNVGSASIDLKVTGGDRADAEIEKTKREVEGIADKGNAAKESAKALRDVLKEIALPVAITAAISRLLEKIDETRASVAELNAEFGKIGTEASQSLSQIGRPSFGELDDSLRALRERTGAALQQISDDATKQINDIQHRTVPGMLWAWAFGGKTEKDVEEAAQRATDVIRAQQEKAQDRLIQRQKEKDQKAAEEKAAADAKDIAAIIKAFDAAGYEEEQNQKRISDRMEQIREKQLQDQIDAEMKIHETRMKNLDEYERRLQDIIRQQEDGFGLSDAGVISGGAGLRGSILARFGRSSGGRG